MLDTNTREAFLARIGRLEDPDLIAVLYGDLVRQVFSGYRVVVTPGRPTPGATSEPRLMEVENQGPGYGRVRLFDDLVVISGPPGSLDESHRAALAELRCGVERRRRELEQRDLVDPLTGLANERSFHRSFASVTPGSGWTAWLMCLTIHPDPDQPWEVAELERGLIAIAQRIQRAHPQGGLLFRMANGFFLGLLPPGSDPSWGDVSAALDESLRGWKVEGVAQLGVFASSAAVPRGRRDSFALYQTLMQGLASQGGLRLADLRRGRWESGR